MLQTGVRVSDLSKPTSPINVENGYNTGGDIPVAKAITRRSVGGGLFLMAILAIITPFAEYRMHSVELFQGELPIGALAILVVLFAPGNWLLSKIRPAWTLTFPEMVFMFIMGYAGLMVYHIGMMGLFISMISSPYYFASPINRYDEFLIPSLPQWSVVTNSAQEMTWFYNGLPPGESIPWMVWIGPLFWWWSFFVAFLLVCSALTAIIRKQWFDHENIRFPQAEITLGLMKNTSPGASLPDMMRSRLFWYGASIPFLLICWNIIGYFTPLWPHIVFTQDPSYVVIPKLVGISVKPDFLIIGFMYFVDTNVVFSLWFFRLIILIQDVVYQRLGIQASTRNDKWATRNALTAWECLGGLFIWMAWAGWMGRHHLAAAWQRARDPQKGADDSNELLSYRTSFLLLGGGLLYMLIWLVRLGMAVHVAIVFLFALMVLIVAITRVVAISGMPFVGAPVTAQGVTMKVIGDANMGTESMVGISLSLAAFRMIEGYPMPMVMHAARLGDAVHGNRRSVFMAIIIGTILAMVLMSLTTIILAYDGGAFNFGQHHAFMQMYEAYDHMVGRIRSPWKADSTITWHFLAGGAFIAGLMFVRYRFGWSGLHPVGFFTAGTYYHGLSMMSFLLAWIIKVAIQRIGGLALYERGKPFFLGLIAGQVTGAMTSLAVDFIFFPGAGHDVFTGFAF
jgi:hypothetical protein